MFIPTNKKVAIVGPSGQGKTTIFNLLTRVFDPIKGNIYIDNIDLLELSEDNLRSTISIIRQDPFLFNKTIKENLLIVNSKLTNKRALIKQSKIKLFDEATSALDNNSQDHIKKQLMI